MDTLMLTLVIAFVFILVALTLLGIGYLITGKPGFQLRRCGQDPTKKRSKESGCETETTCSICGKTDDEEEKK